jgi:hypothetical protein
MKLIVLFILLNTALASECHRYEMQGLVKTNKLNMQLIVNDETRSKLTFDVPLENVHKLTPYIDGMVKGQFLFQEHPSKTKKIETIVSVERVLPDPLHPTQHTYVRYLGKEKCAPSEK